MKYSTSSICFRNELHKFIAHEPPVDSVIDLKLVEGAEASCKEQPILINFCFGKHSTQQAYIVLLDLSQYEFNLLGNFREQDTRLCLDVLIEQQFMRIRHIIAIEILLFAHIVQPIIALHR